MAITVLIADDEAAYLALLRHLLRKSKPPLNIIGEAMDGFDAVRLARDKTPRIVLIDIVMPRLNGIAATRKIVQANPATRVIGLSAYTTGEYVFEMLQAGACGFLDKNLEPREIGLAIKTVLNGQIYVTPAATNRLIAFTHRGDEKTGVCCVSVLTHREREILQLLGEGASVKDIAALLGISPATVYTHRQHITDKLGLHTAGDFVRAALHAGLIKL